MPVTVPPDIVIVDEDTAYRYAERMQMLIQFATALDTQATALRQRIIWQLRTEGLDSTNFLGFGSDAARVASRAVQPLRAASTEAENIARAGVLFRRNMESMVFAPIAAARAERKNPQSRGLRVGGR